MLVAQPIAAAALPRPPAAPFALRVRRLGLTEHAAAFAAMRQFTAARDANSPDEIWLTEHAPVYTLGLAGKPEHVLDPGHIPVVAIDRGGQVTYHGPGQVVAYMLIDLRRRDLKVRELVARIEDAVIATLAGYGVPGHRRAGMPGVYVHDAKIAALGLKVKNGCTYHGVSLNVAMDLTPFAGINPCGYEGLAAAQLNQFVPGASAEDAGGRLAAQLAAVLESTTSNHS
ncbi:MAG TPA: lipoyl(octanoyl) transferase LipB [Burkholderiales bacterium]|jgi:lipoyl(octanoyl) transferase|nr:lipoyl(octanoyl) transferase LipB [Burkholderiales bacterium]